LQGEVQSRRLVNGQRDARLDELAESGLLGRDLVRTRNEWTHQIETCPVGFGALDVVGVGVLHMNLHSGERGAVGVRYQTG